VKYAAGRWRTIAFLSAAFIAWIGILAMYGFLPGMSQVPLTAIFGTGAIQCLHDQGISSLWTWCMSLGLPVGAPRLTGLPEVYFGWLVSYVPGVDAWTAHQVSKAACFTVAMLGGFLLLRRWGIARWIALGAVVAYLSSVSLVVLNGYPYTLVGYAMVPAFAWATLKSLDHFQAARVARALMMAVGLSLVMVFTEGYAFFGFVLVAGCLTLGWGVARVRAGCWREALLGVGSWLAAMAGSAVLYAVWVPGDAYSTDVPLEYFGLLGVDLATLIAPSSRFLFPGALGIEPPRIEVWGDAVSANFLGYLTVVLGVVFLALVWRGRRQADHHAELLAIGVAGVVALILSLGPTLRAGQVDAGLDASLLTLPTAWLYESVPGLSDMRATHRWLIISRLAVIFMAAAGLNLVWERRRNGSWRSVAAVAVVGVFALLETAPSIRGVIGEREGSVDLVAHLRDGIVAEAGVLLHEDELVLMLPSVNDFLANYLVPMAGARSYNVGGDKNYYLSTGVWPADVLAARDHYYQPDAADYICRTLNDSVEAVVLPYMDPYAGPLLRVPDVAAAEARTQFARSLAGDARFVADVGEWMVVVRSSGEPCDESA
jgi:hypothetical protein